MKKCTTCGRYMDMKKALKFRKPFKKEPSDTVKKELLLPAVMGKASL